MAFPLAVDLKLAARSGGPLGSQLTYQVLPCRIPLTSVGSRKAPSHCIKDGVENLLDVLGYHRVSSDFKRVYLRWISVTLMDQRRFDREIFPLSKYRSLDRSEIVNRIVGLVAVVNPKDAIEIAIRHARHRFPAFDWSFYPKTYLLPTELPDLLAAMGSSSSSSSSSSDSSDLFVYKPAYGGQGLGVSIVKDASELTDTSSEWVVQEYIKRPLLIDNRKFTIRLYCLVTSFDPPRVYLYQDGIIKFTSMDHSLDHADATDIRRHVTNMAANKGRAGYKTALEGENDQSGSRWSLHAFFRYLNAQGGVNVTHIWSEMQRQVTSMMLMADDSVRDSWQEGGRCPSCFQLLGVDVELDADYKVWFLEANGNPTLALKTQFPWEHRQKAALLSDVYRLTGIAGYNVTTATQLILEKTRVLMGSTWLSALTEDEQLHLAELILEDAMQGAFHRTFPSKSWGYLQVLAQGGPEAMKLHDLMQEILLDRRFETRET